MSGNSFISQFLSIAHDIQSSFDYKPPTDVRAIFLGISKAFDKMWRRGLLFKLKYYGVEVNFLGLLEKYLDKQKKE